MRWAVEDSNLRRLSQRVYSPPPLAARVTARGEGSVAPLAGAWPHLPCTPVEQFDVIVVGAGPGGSTTAYRLAAAGRSVLLLDRAEFPRDKPCGGGLTLRAVKLLPFSVEPVVEARVDEMRFRVGFRSAFARKCKGPVVLMTQRKRLDHFLVEQAQAAGADFRQGAKVTAVEQDADGVTVRWAGGEARAAALVGADGCNGVVVRLLGLGGDYTHGVALEANVPYTAEEEARYAGAAVIELGTVPGGYGWVFPKGDHFNVGVGGWAEEGPRLREHLAALCDAHGVTGDRLAETRGYRLPLRRADSPLVQGRTLLVGDAAGVVDPLTGDGMYEAIMTGKLAAAAILDVLEGRTAELGAYESAVRRALGPLAAASWGAKVAFDRFPRATFLLARVPIVWRAVEGLMRGELSHPGAARGLARGPLRAIQALARAAGDPGRAYKPTQ